MTGNPGPSVVELKIPSRPEFVGVARLTILGVASRMPFTYDEVEDIRLAVGEACARAVERAKKANKADSEITITSDISGEKLKIEVKDEVGPVPEAPAGPDEPPVDPRLLMELLVDEFNEESTPEGGTLVSMVKYPG